MPFFQVHAKFYVKEENQLMLLKDTKELLCARDKDEVKKMLIDFSFNNPKGAFKEYAFKKGRLPDKIDCKIRFKLEEEKVKPESAAQKLSSLGPTIMDMRDNSSLYLKKRFQNNLKYILKITMDYYGIDSKYNSYLAKTEEKIITLVTDEELNHYHFIRERIPVEVQRLLHKQYGKRTRVNIEVLAKEELPQPTSTTEQRFYINHCWLCGRMISHTTNVKCSKCGWYNCECGACRQGGCL